MGEGGECESPLLSGSNWFHEEIRLVSQYELYLVVYFESSENLFV